MGKVAGAGGSVYGTATCSANACALTDATAWSVQYDSSTQLSDTVLTSGKVKLMSGDGTVSQEYYLWGDARGKIADNSLLAKTNSGLTLTYTDVKNKGGFNIYGYKEQASGTGKTFRTAFTGLTGHSAWLTAKKALVVLYKEVSDKFELWYKIPEAYAAIGANACTFGTGMLKQTDAAGAANAAACET